MTKTDNKQDYDKGDDWNRWVEFMSDNYHKRIPSKIAFRVKGDDGEPVWSTRTTEDATLDELANAVFCLDDEILRLKSERDVLFEIQKRAQQYVLPGTTTIYQAMFPDQENDNTDQAIAAAERMRT